MKSTSDKIDTHIRKERLKITVGFILFFVLLSGFYALFVFPPMGEQELIAGKVLTLTASESEEGNKLYLVVQVERDRQVRVLIPNASLYRKGETVKLLKRSPKFFGRTMYKFMGYPEENA